MWRAERRTSMLHQYRAMHSCAMLTSDKSATGRCYSMSTGTKQWADLGEWGVLWTRAEMTSHEHANDSTSAVAAWDRHDITEMNPRQTLRLRVRTRCCSAADDGSVARCGRLGGCSDTVTVAQWANVASDVIRAAAADTVRLRLTPYWYSTTYSWPSC